MLFFNKYIFYESTSEKTVLMYAENGHGKILIDFNNSLCPFCSILTKESSYSD